MMKVFFFLLLIFISLEARHVEWMGNYEKAHQRALKENKQLMVLLIQKGNPTCQELIPKVFINQKYVEIINEKFISVIVTKGQKSSYPIEMLYTLTYPSIFFLNKYELFSCKPIDGDITPTLFETHLNSCF